MASTDLGASLPGAGAAPDGGGVPGAAGSGAVVPGAVGVSPGAGVGVVPKKLAIASSIAWAPPPSSARPLPTAPTTASPTAARPLPIVCVTPSSDHGSGAGAAGAAGAGAGGAAVGGIDAWFFTTYAESTDHAAL